MIRVSLIAYTLLAALTTIATARVTRSCGLQLQFAGIKINTCQRQDVQHSASPHDQMVYLQQALDQTQSQYSLAYKCQAPQPPDTPKLAVHFILDTSPSMQFCVGTTSEELATHDQLRKEWQQQFEISELYKNSDGFDTSDEEYKITKNKLDQVSEDYVQSWTTLSSCSNRRNPNSRKENVIDGLTRLELHRSEIENTAFWVFDQCDAPPRATDIAELVNSQWSSNSSLASSLRNIPKILDRNVGRIPELPALVILIADGRDSCGEDICKAAEAAALRLPHTTVVFRSAGAQTEQSCVEKPFASSTTKPYTDELLSLLDDVGL